MAEGGFSDFWQLSCLSVLDPKAGCMCGPPPSAAAFLLHLCLLFIETEKHVGLTKLEV